MNKLNKQIDIDGLVKAIHTVRVAARSPQKDEPWWNPVLIGLEEDLPILIKQNLEQQNKLEKVSKLTEIAINKILNSPNVSYGLNELTDIQRVLKGEKPLYNEI